MSFTIHSNCRIHPSVVIDVKEGFIGSGAVINEGARIEGQRVEIGREAFIDYYALIGGGSCFDPNAFLKAGDWLHLGRNSQINIARGVEVGHEFGCGVDSKIFTHGAYTDSWSLGAPVQWAPVIIGDNVWMPNAWVNPGVTIGSNVVVAARSLVNCDLPAGCLAGGVPVKILRDGYLPRTRSPSEKAELVTEILSQARLRWRVANPSSAEPVLHANGGTVICREDGAESIFDLDERTISGAVTPLSRMVKDQLRRNGIRFRYGEMGQKWIAWNRSAP